MTFKWYVVQAYSGSEKNVLRSINQRAEKAGLLDLVNEILIPSKKVLTIKKGKKVEEEKNFFPGYVLINANLTDQLWHVICGIPKVSGFVSRSNKPVPISKGEVDSILNQIEDDSLSLDGEVEYEIGETVRIIDGGPFDNFTGVTESVDTEKKLLTVSVMIFGRSTPVNISFTHVEKI